MTTKTYALTPYGPGKFDFVIDALAYDLSLDGCDDEASLGEGAGWYGIVRGFRTDGPCSDLSATARLDLKLTDDDLAFLRDHHAGFILYENSSGAVDVEWYSSAEERDRAWSDIVSHVEEWTTDGQADAEGLS